MKHFSVVKNVVWLLQAHENTVSNIGIVLQALLHSLTYTVNNNLDELA